MTDEPRDVSEIGPPDLTNEERQILASMIKSDAWKILTDKVWGAYRKNVMASVLATLDSRAAGIYDGLRLAEHYAVMATVQPQKPEEREAISEANLRPMFSSTGGILG